MRRRMVLMTVAALTLAISSTVHAQGKGSVEIGFDAGVNIQIIDDIEETDVQVGFPSQNLGGIGVFSLQTIRLGFYTTDRGQIETSVGFSLNETQSFSGGSTTFTQLALGLEPLWNFPSENATPYLKGGGLFRLIADEDDVHTQFGMRFGAGMKVRAADRVAFRLEGTAARWFESDAFRGHFDFGGAIGLSVFTK